MNDSTLPHEKRVAGWADSLWYEMNQLYWRSRQGRIAELDSQVANEKEILSEIEATESP